MTDDSIYSDPVVEPELWEAAKGATSPSEALGPFHLYLDVSSDTTHATLAGAAQIEDITHVWVVDQCRQLRFDRWLAAEKAKWQAEALRDAVRDMRAARNGSWNLPDPLDPEVAYSVDVWLEVRANRIAKGADR